MSKNSPLSAALAAETKAFLAMKAAREEAAKAFESASSVLEILRAAVNRAQKERSQDVEARRRVLRETEGHLLGKAMAKLAAASLAHAEAADALAAATSSVVVPAEATPALTLVEEAV